MEELKKDEFLNAAGKQLRARLAELVRAEMVSRHEDEKGNVSYSRIFGIEIEMKAKEE